MRKRAKSSNDLASFFEPVKIEKGFIPEKHVDSDKISALGNIVIYAFKFLTHF